MVTFEVLFGNIPVHLAAPSNTIIVSLLFRGEKLQSLKKKKKLGNRLQTNVSKKFDSYNSKDNSNLKTPFTLK